MLILYEVEKLGRICFPNELKRLNLQRGSQFSDHVQSLLRTERFLKQLLRIGNTALGNILLSQTHLIKFIYNFFLDLRSHTSCVGDLQGQLLNLLFLQMFENGCRFLRPQGDQKNGCFLYTLQIVFTLGHKTAPFL